MPQNKRKRTSVAEILREEFMAEYGWDEKELARQIGAAVGEVELLLAGGALSDFLAVSLAEGLGTTREFWFNLDQGHRKV